MFRKLGKLNKLSELEKPVMLEFLQYNIFFSLNFRLFSLS